MRTDAEKQEFTFKCLEIEKAGGDVQGYIAKNWPSYSPRATWYNLQRQYLKRNTKQLTEGRPKAPTVKIDRKERIRMAKRRSRKELLQDMLKVLEEKKDPIAWLKDQGYANPYQTWADLKKWANANNLNQGRLPSNLKKYYAGINHQEAAKAPVDDQAKKNPPEIEKPMEVVSSDGEVYEKFDGVKKYPPLPNAADKDIYGNHPVTAYIEKKVSPTCCQPAPESGVTVLDELPEEHLQIAAVRSAVCDGYKYERVFGIAREDNVALVWRDPVCRGENSLIFSAENWMKLAREIPIMLDQLGLS